MNILKINKNLTLNLFVLIGYIQVIYYAYMFLFESYTFDNILTNKNYLLAIDFWGWFLYSFFYECVIRKKIEVKFNDEYANNIPALIYFGIGVLVNLYTFMGVFSLLRILYCIFAAIILSYLIGRILSFNIYKVTRSFTLNLFILYGYVHIGILLWLLYNGYNDSALVEETYGAFMGFVYIPSCFVFGCILLAVLLLELLIRRKIEVRVDKEYAQGRKIIDIYFWIGMLGNLIWLLPIILVILSGVMMAIFVSKILMLYFVILFLGFAGLMIYRHKKKSNS